jgi:bifunctional pyridoxal-dependent enzyme with beta-cystathionase and maltose regulon repressor activities
MLAAAQARLSGAGFPTPLPDAYPFLWVDISASGLTSTAAARRLAEPAGREPAVLVAPGTRFAAGTRSRVGEGFIRLTLDPAGPPLLPAIERLIETLRGRTL